MGVSIFLARVFGLYLVIVCLAVLYRYKYIQAAYDEMVGNKAHLLIGAVLSLIIGILIVVSHSVFAWNWRLLITLLGYLALIKGVVLLYCPEPALKFKRYLMSNRTVYFIIILIFLLIGIFLSYKGCFCFGRF